MNTHAVYNFEPRILHHSWGTAKFLSWTTDGHVTKLLEFRPGFQTSYHYHLKREETLYIFQGRFTLRTTDPLTGAIVERQMIQGQSYEIPAGIQHSICDSGTAGKIIETTIHYTEEDVLRTYNDPSVPSGR